MAPPYPDSLNNGVSPVMGVAGPVCQDQKNASPKAGVFRSEVGYLRRSQATEASDAFWVYSSIWSKLRYL